MYLLLILGLVRLGQYHCINIRAIYILNVFVQETIVSFARNSFKIAPF